MHLHIRNIKCFFTFVHIHRGSVDHPKKQAMYFARSLGCWFAMLLWMEHPCNRKPPISSTIFVTLAGETPVCVLLLGSLPWHSPWKFTGTQKERIIFQPSFFRGELLNFGGVYINRCRVLSINDVITVTMVIGDHKSTTHAGKQPLNRNPCATGSL